MTATRQFDRQSVGNHCIPGDNSCTLGITNILDKGKITVALRRFRSVSLAFYTYPRPQAPDSQYAEQGIGDG